MPIFLEPKRVSADRIPLAGAILFAIGAAFLSGCGPAITFSGSLVTASFPTPPDRIEVLQGTRIVGWSAIRQDGGFDVEIPTGQVTQLQLAGSAMPLLLVFPRVNSGAAESSIFVGLSSEDFDLGDVRYHANIAEAQFTFWDGSGGCVPGDEGCVDDTLQSAQCEQAADFAQGSPGRQVAFVEHNPPKWLGCASENDESSNNSPPEGPEVSGE